MTDHVTNNWSCSYDYTMLIEDQSGIEERGIYYHLQSPHDFVLDFNFHGMISGSG
jgi:hypothetical protein